MEDKNSISYIVGIPYFNRYDLLRKALNSIQLFLKNTLVIDNSYTKELSNIPYIYNMVKIYTPNKSLSFAKAMNIFQKIGIAKNCDVVMYMHTDAEALPGTPEKLLELIAELKNNNRKWGVVFTNYDTLAAYNIEAIKEVGHYDINLPFYYTDCDWYLRIRQAGYEMINSNLPVKHLVSSSIKSDRKILKYVIENIETWKQYYLKKHGLNDREGHGC